ncbi:hypothetical protein ERY13_33345 [Paenibacillus mucilaginosus]|nr:hypothetical protein ERY13_33345 [Paenibacillus mucilaginosus]
MEFKGFMKPGAGNRGWRGQPALAELRPNLKRNTGESGLREDVVLGAWTAGRSIFYTSFISGEDTARFS